MHIRLILTASLMMFGVFSILATPARGGMILIGGEDGTTDPPAPTEGAETEEDWNPTVTCSIGAGQGIFDLLACLENEISNPPPACHPDLTSPPSPSQGPVDIAPADDPEPCVLYPNERSDFNVWILLPPPDRWGIEIRRLDGSEIERITLRENDPGIQTTELQLDAGNHVARIRLIDQNPSGVGSVFVSINDKSVSIPTSLFPTALEVNAEIVRLLRRGLFDVTLVDGFLNVGVGRTPGIGIRRVQFRSTDHGITESDLSLLPGDDSLLRPRPILVPDDPPL